MLKNIMEGVRRMVGRTLLKGRYKYIEGHKIIKYADTKGVVCEYLFKAKNLKSKKIERIRIEAVYDFGVRPMSAERFWHLFCGK